MSLEDFGIELRQVICAWPLYRPFKFKEDAFIKTESMYNGTSYSLLVPKEIKMDCTSTDCGHPQPFDLHERDTQVFVSITPSTDGVFEELTYICRACHSVKHYWLRFDATSKGGTITKVGQSPALTLEPPPLVAAGMEKGDLKFYRQALTLRNHNLGIAACAYLRRIVENRTNFLIDLAATIQREEDPESPLLQRVEEVKKDWRFSEKINFAAELLPKNIRLGGHNPVSQLHSLTSEALHGLSDEESVDVFDRCQLAFEHVIKRLKQDHDEDQSYRDALKKMNEKTASKKPAAE